MKTQTSPSLPDWGCEYSVGYCPQCDWRFLVAGSHFPEACPHCFIGALEKFDQAELAQLTDIMRPPELYLPFTLPAHLLDQKLAQFAEGIPFAPQDLKIENLQKRLQKVWLPVWLIDSEVHADWQGEAGFNYQVKSHQERYGDHVGWQTQEVVETRQRWEPRQGHLERAYHNVTANALEAHPVWVRRLGKFDFENAQPYDVTAVFTTSSTRSDMVCLPDRSQQDAWPDALPAFQSLAAGECRQACGADHMREFHWKPKFHHQNWSMLLLPVQATFYMDDDNRPQQVLIHGQSGKLSGIRRASMRRAQAVSLTILMTALVIFAVSLCAGAFSTLSPTLLPLAGIGIIFALLVALGAIYPVAVVWLINRKL